jgi:hypothetical protein
MGDVKIVTDPLSNPGGYRYVLSILAFSIWIVSQKEFNESSAQ